MNANPNIISKYGTEESCIILQLTAVFVLATLCQQRLFLRYLYHVSFSGIWWLWVANLKEAEGSDRGLF